MSIYLFTIYFGELKDFFVEQILFATYLKMQDKIKSYELRCEINLENMLNTKYFGGSFL